MFGTGSQITSVVQIRDRFLDRKYWNQSAIAGRHTAVNQHLTFVETVFNQVQNVGVMRTFNNFFSTTQDLVTRAHEPTFRTNVITNAYSLTEQIRQNAASLQRQQRDLNMEFADVITTINSLGNQLSDINRQIHLFERDGSNANDLRDQRALLIDQLSELINIEVEERDFSRPGVENDRRTSILINGQMFVDHTRTNTLELVPREHPYLENSGPKRNEMDVHGLYDVFFEHGGTRFDIHSPTLGGVLRGIVDVRDGNGGQATAPPTLTGRFMLQTQLSALDRTVNFLSGIEARLNTLASPAGLTEWVNSRDDALAAINATNPASPVTTIAQANAWLTELLAVQSRREDAHTAIANTRAALTTTIGLPGIRATIGATFLNNNPEFNDLLNNVQSVLNEISNADFDLDTFNLTAFTGRLEDALSNLSTALDNHSGFTNQNLINSLNTRVDGLSNLVTPLQTALTNLENLNPAPDLDETITSVIDSISQLSSALSNISEITTFTSRLQVQLDWAVTNAQIMLNDVEQRIYEIDNGISPGVAADYAELLQILQTEVEVLRAIAEGLEELNAPGIYDDEAALSAFINSLLASLNGNEGITQFISSLENITNAPVPAGFSIPVTATSNFKGIPFYMNQLNDLVRTFARAINEGRDTRLDAIPGTIGHIHGFNGEVPSTNQQTMFFTHRGGPTDIDNNQGFQKWFLADPADSTQMWRVNGNPVFYPGVNSDPTTPDFSNATVSATLLKDSFGNPLFTMDYSGMNALNFVVNEALTRDPFLLAASSSPDIGVDNNAVITGFNAVGSYRQLFREGRLVDFIIATSDHLAVDMNQALRFTVSMEEIITQTHNQRLSIKGVDLNEEMMDLVRFQHLFMAASRLVNVIDSVYDTLINRLGAF
jgi:flagellar hook-associated protein FlgK